MAGLTLAPPIRYGAKVLDHNKRSNDVTRPVGVTNSAPLASRLLQNDAYIFQQFEPAVRRFCRSRTRTVEDADDAVQDTFMRYLRRSNERMRNNQAWLIRAASRACADINRRRQRDDRFRSSMSPWTECFEPSVSMDVPDDRATDPEQLTIDHLVVAELLRRMSFRERLVVTHLYLMGATTTQVAAYLGVTRNHLRLIALRARRHARAIIAAMDRERSH
jgi:RNA polymerase sigma-70 factor (ECF subfamily)